MPISISMPKVGFSMERGTIVQWMKSLGAEVRKGEVVLLIQTEKVECEVEAQASGKLLRILAQPGQDCPPGHLLGVIGEEGEDVEAFVRAYRPDQAEAVAAMTAGVARSTRDATAVAGPDEIRVSPRARRLAEERGVDLRQVSSALPEKRITEQDVLRFLETPPTTGSAPRVARRIPLAGMRRTIAEKMLEASQGTAMVALSISADFHNAERLRQAPVTYLDIVIKAAAWELRQHRVLNSAIRNNHVEVYDSIHIGFAVSLDDGLIVPVIRDADTKPLLEISRVREQLAERARTKRLTVSEVQGGTFTISSLGGYGITHFTPILNPPQTAILGVGAVEQVPAVVGDRIEIRPRLPLTLVFDHCATDGAPAAAFLKAVRERIENGDLS